MELKFDKSGFILRSHGEPVKINKDNDSHSIFSMLGYNIYWSDDDYTVNNKELKKSFIRIENLQKISEVDDKFSRTDKVYKHKGLDVFLVFHSVKKRTCLRAIYYKEASQKILDVVNKCLDKVEKTKASISIVLKTMQGFVFKNVSINPLPIDVNTMYNDDFKPVYEHITESLSNTDKGVVMLHGIAGTGKTNFIKHLTSKVDKQFIFIPVGMVGYLDDPSFLGELLDNDKSVLVIEDCENYIQDREATGGNNVVSTILNLTDGILSDVVGIQIICTFNTNIGKIDKTLLRSGRLIDEYKFDYLQEDKVKALCEENKIEMKSYEKVALSDIFNFENKSHKSVEKSFSGFRRPSLEKDTPEQVKF